MEIELTVFNTLGSAEGINAIKFDRNAADSIYKLLIELGAAKDIRCVYKDDGGIYILKRVYTPCDMDADGNEQMRPERLYSLYDYIKLLIRFDRSAHKRMNNIKNKINAMHQAIEKLEKQL